MRAIPGVLVAVTVAVGFAAPASAATSSVLAGQTVSGTAIGCTAQGDGVRVCHGADGGTSGPDLRFKGVSGTPLEVYVILPPAPASGSDGPYPLIVQSHGYGQSAEGPGPASGVSEYLGPTADTWAKAGYAVVQLTARGFGDSCGKATSPAGLIACGAGGYIRLDDDRYEVRDVQNAVGVLVDEGLADPGHIGVTGESYGGGVSLQLATLKDRVMDPDGTLHPWTSPHGTPLHVAAAAPIIPWSDLAYSLLPNGRTVDFAVTAPAADTTPIGVEKQSFVTGLYALGQATGNYVVPGLDSQADLTTWFGLVNAGEPYDGNPAAAGIVDQITRYHSAYYLLDGRYGAASEPPPPLLIANGFTDDLFPVDEGLRYYNLEHAQYPGDPISLFDWDGGHQRGQNKKADNALLASTVRSFFDAQLKGAGPMPAPFTALTQTCPAGSPSGGPFTAATWSGLHPGEVGYSTTTGQTLASAGGDPTVAKAFDPIAGGGACATAPAGDETGTATYRLPAATGSGYTLLGSATLVANLHITGAFPEIAARLLDVDPATNTETLVARGLYRPTADGSQSFQLHPGAWHFAAGHIPKLELLGRDAPYARASNGQFTIAVTQLQLRLPVHEVPGSPGTPSAVHQPLPAPGAGSGSSCRSSPPSSTIAKRRTRVSPRAASVQGGAQARVCAQAPIATRRRQAVRSVYVMIYRPATRGRCRFVARSGRLTRPRPCTRPLEYRARGTTRWSLRLRLRLVPGHYLVRSDAVNGFGQHQRRTGASVQAVVVRRSRR